MRVRIGVGTLGLLAGLGAPHLAAQSWALPASDPVGIARSGAGVAYGNSLEAAAINPALLATLRDDRSAYLSAGMELQDANAALQSNQQTQVSSNRNRFLPAMGAAWRLNPTLVLGLKLDEPFMRHVEMPMEYTGRFQGQAIDLATRRLEGQIGWAASPNWAFGASLGLTRVQYSWDNMVRTVINNPNSPGGTTPLGLMETDLHQEGDKLAPSYSLGFRWALDSRWTIGGTYVGAIKTTLPLSANYGPNGPNYYALSGYGSAPTGTSTSVKPGTQLQPSSGGITLPGKLTLGLRQRVNTLFTWEADVRYMMGAQMELPGYPTATPAGGGPVSGSGENTAFRSGFGLSLMGELTIMKNWVARLGVSLDPGLLPSSNVEPLVGGAKSSGMSAGVGYRVFGGEVNVGYQYRQVQVTDVQNLDGYWKSTGYGTNPGSVTRVGGMGHLWSVGFKKAF